MLGRSLLLFATFLSLTLSASQSLKAATPSALVSSCYGPLTVLSRDGVNYGIWAIARTKDGSLHYVEGPYTASHQAIFATLSGVLAKDSQPQLIAAGELKYRKSVEGKRTQKVYTPTSGTIQEMIEFQELDKNHFELVAKFEDDKATILPYNPEEPHLLAEMNIQEADGSWKNFKHSVGNAATRLGLLGVKGIGEDRQPMLKNIESISMYINMLRIEKRLPEAQLNSASEALHQLANEIREGKFDDAPESRTGINSKIDALLYKLGAIFSLAGVKAQFKPHELIMLHRPGTP